MGTLVDRLEQINFAKEIFSRSKKESARVLEFDTEDIRGHTYPSVFLILAYSDAGILNQIFINQGKSGADENAHTQCLARLTSICLQHGVPPQAFIKTLRGIDANVKPYEITESGKTTYHSIEDLLAHKMMECVLQRQEPLDPAELTNGVYSRKVLDVPDEGDAQYKKLRFGSAEAPPLYITFTQNDAGLLNQVFLARGKSGADESAHAESLAKLISISLQYGLHPFRVAKSLIGMKSSLTSIADQSIYQSMEDAVGRLIIKWYVDRGVNLEESYARVFAPKPSLKKINLDLLDNGNIDTDKDPCPSCMDLHYQKLEKPGTRGCFTYSCCGYEAGACS